MAIRQKVHAVLTNPAACYNHMRHKGLPADDWVGLKIQA